ncbi:MAG: hypothetical protein ABIH72_03695 [archaeon]
MKKWVIILLLLLPLVSAISTDIKEVYEPGETLITIIEGNFIDPITISDISFISARKSVPMIYDLGKFRDKYYLYSLLPYEEKNYTLVIRDAHYFELGERQEDININFSVKGNLTKFQVSPGFIITDKSFKISIESISESVQATVDFEDSSKSVSVPLGQKKEVELSVEGLENETETFVKVSANGQSYEVPVIIFAQGGINNQNYEKFIFSTGEISMSILINQQNETNLSLINIGDLPISNISLIADKELENVLTIQPEQISYLDVDEEKEIKLIFSSLEEGYYIGNLQAIAGNLTTSLSLNIYFTKNESTILPPPPPPNNNSDGCYDLGGYICAENQECDGSLLLSSDGECCIGICKDKKSYTSTIVAIILILVVVGIIGFSVYKSKKGKPKSSRQLIEKSQSEFEDRFKPTEAKGSLSRI